MEPTKFEGNYVIDMSPVMHDSLDEIPPEERLTIAYEPGTSVLAARSEYIEIVDDKGNRQVYEIVEGGSLINEQSRARLVKGLKQILIEEARNSLSSGRPDSYKVEINFTDRFTLVDLPRLMDGSEKR